MRLKTFVLFTASLMLVPCFLAMAAPLTLEFSNGVYQFPASGHVYTERGFTFTTPPGNHFDSSPAPGGLVPGPRLVFHEAANNPVNNVITLAFGGAAFDLLSFDLILDPILLGFNPVINSPMLVTASNGSMLTTPLGSAPGFIGTITAGFTNVTSVAFDIIGQSTSQGNTLLDNVVVTPSSTPPPSIPEPSTWLLFGTGLLGLGFYRWRMGMQTDGLG